LHSNKLLVITKEKNKRKKFEFKKISPKNNSKKNFNLNQKKKERAYGRNQRTGFGCGRHWCLSATREKYRWPAAEKVVDKGEYRSVWNAPKQTLRKETNQRTGVRENPNYLAVGQSNDRFNSTITSGTMSRCLSTRIPRCKT
jgi:hypothetical protein